jgi:hypothetical protein
VKAHRVVIVEAPTFSRQSAHRWPWGCLPFAPAFLYPQEDSWYSFLLRGWVDPRAIVRLEGLGQLKNAMTSSGIEPAIFRLVARRLVYQPAWKLGSPEPRLVSIAQVPDNFHAYHCLTRPLFGYVSPPPPPNLFPSSGFKMLKSREHVIWLHDTWEVNIILAFPVAELVIMGNKCECLQNCTFPRKGNLWEW